MLDHIMLGIDYAMSWKGLLLIFIGITWGIIGGAIPGITGSIATALLLPFTFTMDAPSALMMLSAVYVGAEYGGSIPAILIGAPGTSASAPAVLDGYALHKKGFTGKALGTSLIMGTIGGLFSVIVLILVAIPLASVALAFGPPEYFSLSLFGLTIVASLVSKNLIKGIISAFFGLVLATIGMDPFTAEPRYTFGIAHLVPGLELIPVMIGLFAVSELLKMANSGLDIQNKQQQKTSTKFPTLKELRGSLKAGGIGTVIGTFIGIMPGVGGSVGSWISYNEAKRWSKNKEEFGHGSLEGIAAPEAGNNAVTGSALVPLLALGIPGSNSTAVMLGGLLVAGVVPGPLMFEQHPEVPYSVFISMIIAQFFMLIVGYFLIKPAMKVSSITAPVLLAVIFPLVFIGSFSVNTSIFGIIVVLFFGVIGLIMSRYGFSVPATVLGFVLGGIIEDNLRRGMAISNGNFLIFLERPISLLLLILAVLSLLTPFVQNYFEKKRNANLS